MDRDCSCFTLNVVLDRRTLMPHWMSDFCEESTEQGPRDLASSLTSPTAWTPSPNLPRPRVSQLLSSDSVSETETTFKLGIPKL